MSIPQFHNKHYLSLGRKYINTYVYYLSMQRKANRFIIITVKEYGINLIFKDNETQTNRANENTIFIIHTQEQQKRC